MIKLDFNESRDGCEYRSGGVTFIGMKTTLHTNHVETIQFPEDQITSMTDN